MPVDITNKVETGTILPWAWHSKVNFTSDLDVTSNLEHDSLLHLDRENRPGNYPPLKSHGGLSRQLQHCTDVGMRQHWKA